jgi:transcriptional regulator with XRE-family HTH domain
MAIKKTNKATASLTENEIAYQKIGNRIKQLRLKAGFSAAEKFAYENDISRAQYARYERGVDMQISSLLKILAAHGMTLQEFFRGVI